MRSVRIGMLDDVVSSYDQTKTTIQGRAFQGTYLSKPYLSVPPNTYVDTVQDSTLAPSGPAKLTDNNRIFTVTAEAAGVASILLHNFNPTTGVETYVGRINFNLPDVATTAHTYRAIRAIDTGTTGWKIFVQSSASVAINGGLFCLNNIALSDFVPTGFPTIPFATGNDQKAVYFYQIPTALGVLNTFTSPVGMALDTTVIYALNGTAATSNIHAWSTTTAPTWSSAAVTGDAGTDLITDVGHTFANNDPIVFTTSTIGGVTAGTVYFVRNPVAGAYNISTTSGGANLNITANGAGTVGRAFGTTANTHSFSTGNFSAIFAGTLLLTDCLETVTPTNVHPSLNGNPCLFVASTTNFYMGLLSELSSGVTTWPSLQNVNVLGDSTDITLTPTFANWSQTTDCALYIANTSVFYAKNWQSNSRRNLFGSVATKLLENQNPTQVELGAAAIAGFKVDRGWVLCTPSTTGQRGVILYDFRSDSSNDFSYAVSPVVTLGQSIIRSITVLRERIGESFFDIYYRTSGFGSISGGWTSIAGLTDLNIGVGNQIQFKFAWNTARTKTLPSYMYDVTMEVQGLAESSSKWVGSSGNTSPNGASPFRVAFRLQDAYDTSVPQLFVRGWDDAGNAVTFDTVTNIADFEYSTNNGTSWTPLGVIPNTALTTEVRFNWTSPDGLRRRWSINEA